MRFVTPGNVNAKAVMVGTGSTAVQAWPAVDERKIVASFLSMAEIEKLPVQRFDGRTDPLSMRMPSVIFGGRLAPQGNNAPTYECRLMDQVFDGAKISIETVISASPKTLALPSMLVVSAADDANELIGVEYGSNGVRVLSLLGATVRHQYTVAYNLPVGAKLRVDRFLSWIQIYVNGVRIGATTHPTFNLVGSPGVGFYTTTAPSISTPIGATTISGGTTLPKTYGGFGHFARIGVQEGIETMVVNVYVEGGRQMRAIVRNARWEGGVFATSRSFTLIINGVKSGGIGDTNGTDYVMSSPFMLPLHSVVGVQARSPAEHQDNRTIKSGTLELVAV